MFGFFKKEKNYSNENELNIINKILNYNFCFYRCTCNILNENNSIYENLYDKEFPKFNISKLALKIYEDIKNSNHPFLIVIDSKYFEELINKEIKTTSSFKYFKNKIIELFELVHGKGKRSQIVGLFNDNLLRLSSQLENVIKAKMFNNCLINYESEKTRYGLGAEHNHDDPYIRKIEKNYFYLSDTIVSATLIAYLMMLSEKINLSKAKGDEFYTILLNMFNETTDIDIINKKGYELLEHLYSSNYPYLEEEIHFKLFIKMIESINYEKNQNFNDDVDEFLKKFEKLEYKTLIHKAALEQLYLDDDEIMAIIISSIKKNTYNTIESIFNELLEINAWTDYYKRKYKENRLILEKEKYLKGDFSNLKNEEKNKQSLESIKTGTEFEKYLVKLFKDMGYETTHTGKAGDQGCDLLAKKHDKIYCIQAKYYTKDLDNTPVQEIIGSLKHYNGDKGVVITNSSFTEGAYELARSNDVILINGRKLQKLINYLYSDNDINRDILDEIDYL